MKWTFSKAWDQLVQLGERTPFNPEIQVQFSAVSVDKDFFYTQYLILHNAQL